MNMKLFIKFLTILCIFLCLSGFDFLDESGLTVDELETGLLNELKPLAEDFLDIEEEYGINSTLYASMVALESGWGTSNLSISKNNITSHRNGKEYKNYDSKKECLIDTANLLLTEYLREDGAYYHGSTELDDVICYYVLGKPRIEMNQQELDHINNYYTLVYQINEGILRRAK